jgi:GTP-binding protein
LGAAPKVPGTVPPPPRDDLDEDYDELLDVASAGGDLDDEFDAELDPAADSDAGADLDGDADEDDALIDVLDPATWPVDEPVAPPEPHVPLTRIAIVGRPNVGKSTLANRLARRRVSIVDPHAGVTRDRIAQIAELDLSTGRRVVEVVDTGGIGIVDRDDLGKDVERQVHRAIDTSDLVLFMVDAREGLTPLDMTVATWLRGLKKPVLLVANKAEGRESHWEAENFHRLGVGEGPFAISAQNGEGLYPLYERIGELLPAPKGEEKRPSPSLRLTVVGRRNAGKSTLINTWANEERVIVSAIPGTTRDAVDVILEKDGKTVVVVDTAGVRKAKSFEDSIDFYSDARSHQAMRNADVVVLLIDALERVSQIEKKLARYCIDHYKPVILGCNKWDLTNGADPHEFRRYLDDQLPGLDYAPLIFLSAKDGWQSDEVLELAHELLAQTHKRVGTGELNRVLKKALEARSPSRDGDRVRIFYATQAEETPPTFVLFVNDRQLVGKDYLRYLDNRLREAFGFAEIPVRIHLRDRTQKTLEERRTEK